MAPRSSRASGADTDTSMADASGPIRQLPVDPMVREHALIATSKAVHIPVSVIHRSAIWILLTLFIGG